MSADVLQQQLDVSKSLLSALTGLLDTFEKVTKTFQDQASIVSNMSSEMKKNSDSISSIERESQNITSQIIQDAKKNDILNAVTSLTGSITSQIKASSQKSRANARKSQSGFSRISSKFTKMKKSNDMSVSSFLKIDSFRASLESSSDVVNNSSTKMSLLSKAAKVMSLIVEGLTEIKEAFMTSGLSLIKTGLKLLWNFVKVAFNAFTSLVGGMTKAFMFASTLPFTIAKIAVTVGNKIRTDVVEVIQSAGEEVKESFDLTSDIGRGADRLTQSAKGLLKTFQTPRSRLSKLFGMGASGAAAFIRETTKAVADMGHYSEVFGPSLLNSNANGQYLIEMQRALGLGAQELAYYALESYNSGKNPIDTLHETSTMLKEVADQNDLDFKALTKEFHVLRTNIIEFGHMTSNEIGNLVSKLRKMKIKTEDAVNVFKKFSTFEEAAKASAMLFQTFEMNIDAFDLLNSRDPGEMLQQFRDSMFATGKNFKDLNRHEKSLMSSITGISEHSLASLMNFMDLGLTQDEARKKMMEEDPTKEQTEMIKGLTSTIKQFQKTIQFESPFQAFFQGLLENQMNQKGLQNSLISLSEIYSDIRHLGFTLNLSELKSLLGPITEVLRRINNLVNGETFKQIMLKATSTAGKFIDNISYDMLSTKTSKEYSKLRYKIEALNKESKSNSAIKAQEINDNILKTIKSKINLNNLDTNLLLELKNSKIIKKLKNGTYEFVKDQTTKRLFESLTYISENFSENPAVSKELERLLAVSQSAYNQEVNNLTGQAAESINTEAEKRTTVEGRIDNLYDDLYSLFEIGGPHYKNFVDMGGNLMGSIIRGAIKGLSAGFYILADASEQADKILNKSATNQINAAASKKGVNPKNYSVKDEMGLSDKDINDLKDDLSTETLNLVSQLPTMMSMAGTLIADLLEVFGQFAGGVLGIIGDMSYQYYEDSNLATKRLMKQMGYNPERALAAKKGLGSEDVRKSSAFSQLMKGIIKNTETGELEEGYVGVFIKYINDLKHMYDKETPAYKFLNNELVSEYIDTLGDRSKFKFEIIGGFFDDEDNEERSQALIELADMAASLNNILPEEVILAYKDVKDKPEWYKDDLKAANDYLNNTINYLRDGGIDASSVKSNFSNDEEDVAGILNALSLKDQSHAKVISEYIKRNEIKYDKGKYLPVIPKNTNAKKVKDVKYFGRDAILYTPAGIFILDKEDTILAAKKGGFLNSVLIELTESYNDSMLSLAHSYENNIADVLSHTPVLSNTEPFDYYKNEEASEEDIIKIFEVYDELINIINERELVVNQQNIAIQK